MSSAESNVTLHNEFNFGKYDMTSNTTNIFLKIKEVNFSDSGLYVCGPYLEEIPQIFTATYLQVEGKGDIVNMTVIIGYVLFYI